MAVLKVRRASNSRHRELLLDGKWLPVGAEINTDDFPRINARWPDGSKWAQLIHQGIFYDDHLIDPSLLRGVEARRKQYGDFIPAESRMDPEPPVALDKEDVARLTKPIEFICADCGKQMNSEHGLKVHVGRSHGHK